MERKFAAPNGRVWTVRPRAYVRKDEVGSHITLEFVTDAETRIVSCRRDEWETAEPDIAGLFARSVASGAGRVMSPGGENGR
ncbi:MAG: hypothetical protein ACREL3_08685 [Gemmatimonadales bacterium]